VKLPEPDVREPPITIDDYLDAYPMEMMPLPSGPHVPTPVTLRVTAVFSLLFCRHGGV
jgi:hypothetical protein